LVSPWIRTSLDTESTDTRSLEANHDDEDDDEDDVADDGGGDDCDDAAAVGGKCGFAMLEFVPADVYYILFYTPEHLISNLQSLPAQIVSFSKFGKKIRATSTPTSKTATTAITAYQQQQ
jgi:hypothetical protein